MLKEYTTLFPGAAHKDQDSAGSLDVPLERVQRAAMRELTRRYDSVALLLRVAGGLLLCLGHGTMKYDALMGYAAHPFPDPLGLGSQLSVIMSMGAECVASLAVALGLFTRLFTLPVIFTMCTVAVLVHQGAPWLKREPSVLFAVIYTAILILGPGAYSLDAWIQRRRARCHPGK